MIKNERQYRVTQAQAKKFEDALERLLRAAPDEKLHPRLRQAQVDAVRGQLAQLRAELAEYDALRSGSHRTIEWRSLGALADLLIKARIAAGLTQRELAARLDLKEQQIQRYEATGYVSASLARLIEVAKAVGIELRGDVALPKAPPVYTVLVKRLNEIGLDDVFVRRRLVPPTVRDQVSSVTNGRSEVASLRLADNIHRVFGWDTAALFGEAPPTVDTRAVAMAKFKLPARVSEPRLVAYTIYAHYLALLVLQAVPRKAGIPPTDPKVVRREILDTYGSLTLEHGLRYVWSLGVPVLPLADPGSFHGAVWRAGGRNVIVLKQQTPSQARWLFDLFHEFHHAGQEPDQHDRTVIEVEEPGLGSQTSSEEQEASLFAGQVLLDNRADELARQCAQEAGGSVEQLKRVVPRVARQEGVPVDALANYLAFRLSLQGINWWGAAMNLQTDGPRPWLIARDVLLKEIDPSALSDEDRELLELALAGD